MKVVSKMFFISKKDTFYSIAIWGAIAVVFLTMVFPVFLTFSISNFVLLVLGLIIIVWLPWIWFSTGYLVEDNTLIIQAGPFKQTVDIKEIRKIMKEKSILTSGALSIDRLQIQYGKYKYVGISPKKEYEFIKLLRRKNSEVQIDDGLSNRYKL